MHDPLPQGGKAGDEGAPTTCGFAPRMASRASRSSFTAAPLSRTRGRAEIRAAAIARGLAGGRARAQLDPAKTLFLRQAQEAIDAGAFHNDVVAVSNGPALLAHERAFEEGAAAFDAIRGPFRARSC